MDVTQQKGLDDLVLLDSIDDDTVMACLKGRFLQLGQMYTWSGPVLVAVNPYKVLTTSRGGKSVSIYDETIIDAYRGTCYYEVPPHVFSVAEAAYSSMLRYRVPSSITISGESGAGKTEACKQCLLFISRVSGAFLAKAAQQSAAAKGGGKAAPVDAALSKAAVVKDRLLTSTLLLEAFGNAATIRNNNSSRFGKLMTVAFNSRGARLLLLCRRNSAA